MEKIIFATKNRGKLFEINQILKDLPIEVISMKEAGINIKIQEDGKTFEENAIIKAEAVMKESGCIVLADDSGLEIDYFDGAPGVYSARFLGEITPYDVKIGYILDRMKDVPMEDRGARFVCAIACAFPDGRETIVRKGVLEGKIAKKTSGRNGFGYDPVFYLPDWGCTTAQLEPREKNEISHRGKALTAMAEVLKDIFV